MYNAMRTVRSATYLARLLVLAISGTTMLSAVSAEETAGALVAGLTPVSQRMTVDIPMRDGTLLAADIHLPTGSGAWPTILEMTPYGKAPSPGKDYRFWTENGFAAVVVDVRGTAGSGGVFRLMGDLRRDGPDIIAWIREQVWSTGKVGMRGSSYSGTVPFFVAAEQPPGLLCINPNASLRDSFSEPPFIGGAFMQDWAFTWMQMVDRDHKGKWTKPDHSAALGVRPYIDADRAAIGSDLPLFHEIGKHPTLDEYWRESTLTAADYRRITVPTLAFTGWYDTQLPGSWRHHEDLQRHSPLKAHHWIVIGPWDHGGAINGGYSSRTGEPVDRIGPISIPANGFKPAQGMALEFFSWCLNNGQEPNWPLVQAYVPGTDTWISGQRLPPGDTRSMRLFVDGGNDRSPNSRDGTLIQAVGAGGRLGYTYDPQNPVRADKGDVGDDRLPFSLRYGPADVSDALINRSDVLAFMTSPMERPMTLFGPAFLEAWVETTAVDTDFVALLEDVAPDGSRIRLGPGWAGVLRTSYRHGPERLVPMKSGVPTRLTIDLLPIGHTLREGHRLRLSITSSAYPFISVNPNTGGDLYFGTDPAVPAEQGVLFGKDYPSSLYLTILDATASGAAD